MALFKEHGVNPASGCVVMLLQFPILIALYQVLLKIVSITSIDSLNKILYFDALKLHQMWDTTFFGLALGKSPSQLTSSAGYGILLVCVLTGGLQLLQSRMMMQPASEKAKEPKTKKEPDFATAMQTQTMYILPLMVGFFAFSLPFGLSLYWNSLTIFGIIQQYIVSGWGGLADWFPFLKKEEEKISKYLK
jgi:YidC/Oxa1 family membrane protein insertase